MASALLTGGYYYYRCNGWNGQLPQARLIQWGLEYRTCSDFGWLIAFGFRIVFGFRMVGHFLCSLGRFLIKILFSIKWGSKYRFGFRMVQNISQRTDHSKTRLLTIKKPDYNRHLITVTQIPHLSCGHII